MKRANTLENMQQQETLDYFRRAASEWRQKAEGVMPKRVNVIKQRNDYVLEVARTKRHLKRFLDVGCGTGELVCEIARSGVQAVGVDFAAEMIALCREKAQTINGAAAEFVHASIFDYRPVESQFDLISACGFIEYISKPQLAEFIHSARELLALDGALVVGSRNRLFNLFSLNQYTRSESDAGAAQSLLEEAILIASSGDLDQCLDELARDADNLPAFDAHPQTGTIDVTTRHQYTPGQLVRACREAGFRCVGLHPIHYHATSPRFARANPQTHTLIADLMQSFARDCHYLVPFASSFMLHVELG